MADNQLNIKATVQDEGVASSLAGMVESFKGIGEAAEAVGELILKAIEKIQQMQDEVQKMRADMEDAALAAVHQADAIDGVNLRLQDQIAQLEGHGAENGLKEALLASTAQANELSSALEGILRKTNDLLQNQSIGFWKSLATGLEQTKDIAEKAAPAFQQLEEMRRKESLDLAEFDLKNHDVLTNGTKQQQADLAQRRIDLQNHWNEQIKIVTDGVQATVAEEWKELEQEKKAKVDLLKEDHFEQGAEQAVIVSALSLADAEKQVNEQYAAREEALRLLRVTANEYHKASKASEENQTLALKAAQDREAADTKSREDREKAERERRHQEALAAFEAFQHRQMKAFTDGLQARKDALDAFHSLSKQDEAKYWDQILQTVKLKGENLKQVQHLALEAHKAADREALRDELQAVEERVQAVKAGSEERVKILDAEIRKLESENKTDTEEYKRLLKERAQAEKEFEKEAEAAKEAARKQDREVWAIELQSAAQHEQALKGLMQSRLDFERQIGHISEAQYEQELQDEIKATYAAALKELEAKRAVYKQGSVEYAKVEAEIVKLTDKYNADMEKSEEKSLLRRRQQFDQYFRQITSGFNSALNGWIQGTETASQAFTKMFQQIMSELISFVEQWIEKKIEMWLMDALFADQGSQDEKDAHVLADVDQIMADAYAAAANAYAANAYDPVTATVMAADAFATVSGFAASTSALLSGAGGIYRVPFDTVAAIHKDEQVLPASYAQGLRNMIDGGGGSGVTVVINHSVSAIDAESFQGTIRKHGTMIGNEVARVLKKKGLASV